MFFYNDHIAFVHVPKNAGTAVTQMFRQQVGDLSIRNGLNSHEMASYWRDQLGVAWWRQRMVFAVVRNPWDRIASLYRFSVHKHPGKMRRINQDISARKFRPLLERAQEDFDWWLMDFCTKYHFNPLGLGRKSLPFTQIPQCKWLCDGNNEMLVDRVYRFEDLGELWDDFGVVNPERINSTAIEDHRMYYSVKSRQFIDEHFAEDITRWGYEF